MDAVLLCMKKPGIRFFGKIDFPSTNVKRFYGKNGFMNFLRARTKEFDNVLIMAHGSGNAILTTTHNPNHPYATYISADQTDAFRNDFVFAVSCSTANQFGRTCIDKGAIAYLGYEVEFGLLFCSYPGEKFNVPKRVSTAVDTTVKHIFIETLSQAYEEFLKTPINVSVLRQRFSFLLEKRIGQLSHLTREQFRTKYNVNFSDRDQNNFVAKLSISVLTYLDEILPRLVCLGDENYISASSLSYGKKEGIPSEIIAEELESNESFIKMKRMDYKSYLRKTATLI